MTQDWHKHSDTKYLHLTEGYVVVKLDTLTKEPWSVKDASGNFITKVNGHRRCFGTAETAMAAADKLISKGQS